MKTGILLLLLAIYTRIAAGQVMPENTAWTVEQCLAYTTTHNHDLLAQNQLLQAATQNSKAAAATLAPSFTVKGEIDHYWKIPVQIFPGQLLNQPAGTFIPVRMGTPWMGNYGADADLPLIDVQTWQQIKLARLQQQAEKYEYNSLLQTLLKNTRIAYYSVQQQQEYVAVTAKLYGDYQHIHQLITLQFEKGFADKIMLNQSATLLKNREIDAIKAATTLQQDFLDLKFWMGYPLEDSLLLAPITPLPPLAATGFNNTLLPGYEAEQSKVTLAKQQYQTSRAEWYPSVHLKSTWEQLGFGEKSDFINRSPWFSVGFVGIQLSRQILTIFTTSYSQYALKSYELDAIDYLLKPIEKSRLEKTINKAAVYKNLLSDETGKNTIEANTVDFLLIKSERRFHRINFGDIRFIEGLKDYVVIYTGNQKLITAMNLKTIHQKIPPHLFLRVSKSYLVNINYIDSFDHRNVYLGDFEIPLGEVYKKDFFQHIHAVRSIQSNRNCPVLQPQVLAVKCMPLHTFYCKDSNTNAPYGQR